MNRDLLGPYPPGIPSPRHVHVHPYPTRFHGSINTRPVFGFPYRAAPASVFKPDDFNQEGPVAGLGSLQYQTGRGVFRPGGRGGGIFDGNIAGLGALGYAVRDLPWSQYDADTAALQKDINKALRALGKPTILEDGKLGTNTCAAANTAYNAIATGKITGEFGYLAVPPECGKHSTSAPTSTPSTTVPSASTTSEASTLPPLPRRMSSSTKNIMIFGGAAILALGGAFLIMKGMKNR